MKMCNPHWNAIRAEVEKQGLTKFVAASSAELAKKMEAGDRDPLMSAHNAILGSMLSNLGAQWAAENPCCICWMEANRKSRGITEPLDWIEGAVGDELDYFKEKGLIQSQ